MPSGDPRLLTIKENKNAGLLSSPKGTEKFGGTTLVNCDRRSSLHLPLTLAGRCIFMQWLQDRFHAVRGRYLTPNDSLSVACLHVLILFIAINLELTIILIE